MNVEQQMVSKKNKEIVKELSTIQSLKSIQQQNGESQMDLMIAITSYHMTTVNMK